MIAFIADWPATTVNSIRIITPIPHRIIQKVILAHEMLPSAVFTVPVFPAVVGVLIPAVRHLAAVHHVVACRGSRCRGVTVLVAWTTYGALSTVDCVGVVAPHVHGIKQQVVLARVVNPRTLHTMPVLATVVWIRIPTVLLVCTVHNMSTVGSGCWSGRGLRTIFVAFIANWTLPAVYPIREVAPNILRVIQHAIVTQDVL